MAGIRCQIITAQQAGMSLAVTAQTVSSALDLACGSVFLREGTEFTSNMILIFADDRKIGRHEIALARLFRTLRPIAEVALSPRPDLSHSLCARCAARGAAVQDGDPGLARGH